MDFFGRTRHPYYIHAPDFRHTSAGIIALYVLCHTINELGYEAFISLSADTSETLRTPRLTLEVIASHFKQGLIPISLSPEVLNADPFDLPIKARWLLNKPGHLGGMEDIPAEEILFHFDDWVLPEPLRGRSLKLRSPTFDARIFNNDNNAHDQKREGFAYYAHKYLVFGGTVPPTATKWTSLCQDIPRTKAEIADILRRSDALICFEQSSLIAEALACGCPVILVPSDYWPRETIGTLACHPGIALFDQPDALSIARGTIDSYPAMLALDHAYCLDTIKQFIGITQIAALKHQAANQESAKDKHPLSPKRLWNLSPQDRGGRVSELLTYYEQVIFSGPHDRLTESIALSREGFNPVSNLAWLNRRADLEQRYYNNINETISGWHSKPLFKIVVRLNDEELSKLADTIDSLAAQHYCNWTLDVIAPAPAPEAVQEISVLAWHSAYEATDITSAMQSIHINSGYDWIIELPPGAIVEPLYLWRLAEEINQHPDVRAFFVDDYVLNEDGICTALRFKPGVNIEWLQSQDLAGPLCVRRDSWTPADKYSSLQGYSWFPTLLSIAGQYGWAAISHIPDALICYHDALPFDPSSCLMGLMSNLQSRGITGEIIPATSNSWCIRYPLITTPNVSIAIISQGHLDLLNRCLDSIQQKTGYPSYEILISLPSEKNDADLDVWLTDIQKNSPRKIHIIRTPSPSNQAKIRNAAVNFASYDFVLLIDENSVVIQEKWLEELLRTCIQPTVSAVSPCLISPGTSLIENAGYVLGLNGQIGSPYQGEAKLGEYGYLDSLRVARDVSALPSACMLVRKSAYLAAGGMDEIELGDLRVADADLGLKLRRENQRLIFQPLATVVYGGSTQLNIDSDIAQKTQNMLAESSAADAFTRRWLTTAAIDPFFNPNLSLVGKTPTPEAAYRAQWQYFPGKAPRFLARPLPNAQGSFRITAPLDALRKQGMASECIWPMEENGRELTVAELLRLSPDTLIVQHYLSDKQLAALHAWHAAPGRPFVIYTLDDLVSNLSASNPFFRNIPANSRARLKYAMARCDRLVTSTDFLAETYRHFCSDIRVVPNRLEKEVWLPLQNQKRTCIKPRIGWAGGVTHEGDLILLKEVIEQTRNEADWIFFGMCPDEIRPLIAEYHQNVKFSEYPAYLASLNLDIAVAPLEDIPFNHSKSNLRLLEYGVLGIPVICTDITPYRNSPACCVANTPEAWMTALRERIYDAEARESEGASLRNWVHRHYFLEDHLDEWLTAHLAN